mmetsp:Transcript_14362/g.16154  ORF Transcript_14362/g.16154 Transcript_14362/m.16154 type:complete len:95 (-) Transcript_14362:374-658(-)
MDIPFFIGIIGILMTERWTLENGPKLTDEEKNRLAIADALYGVLGLLIVYTGYCRMNLCLVLSVQQVYSIQQRLYNDQFHVIQEIKCVNLYQKH